MYNDYMYIYNIHVYIYIYMYVYRERKLTNIRHVNKRSKKSINYKLEERQHDGHALPLSSYNNE